MNVKAPSYLFGSARKWYVWIGLDSDIYPFLKFVTLCRIFDGTAKFLTA